MNTTAGVTNPIIAAAAVQLAAWDRTRLGRHQLDYTFGDDVAAAARRRNARTVLAADAVLDELLDDTDEPLVLLKGREIAALYPNPVQRHFRDVDVLVSDPETLWNRLRKRGLRPAPGRRADIDHHHLPSLMVPDLAMAIEVHGRVNAPGWMRLDTDLVMATAQPSRTDHPGLLRPRDDVHALIMAAHAWKAGFSRLRDLLDVLLLEAVSDQPVSELAAELGLARAWRFTRRLAGAEILGEADRRTDLVRRLFLSDDQPLSGRTRNRLLMPYLVASPARVTASHRAEWQLAREARRTPSQW